MRNLVIPRLARPFYQCPYCASSESQTFVDPMLLVREIDRQQVCRNYDLAELDDAESPLYTSGKAGWQPCCHLAFGMLETELPDLPQVSRHAGGTRYLWHHPQLEITCGLRKLLSLGESEADWQPETACEFVLPNLVIPDLEFGQVHMVNLTSMFIASNNVNALFEELAPC